MKKRIVLLAVMTSFINIAYANDLDNFIEYHSRGCVLLNLAELGLTLDDKLPKSTADRIGNECQQTLNNAVLYTKKFDLNKKVDGNTKLGKDFNRAKDNFYTGCAIVESIKENYSATAINDKNSAEFKHIYKRCISQMKNGIFAMKEIKPIYE